MEKWTFLSFQQSIDHEISKEQLHKYSRTMCMQTLLLDLKCEYI